MGTPVAWQDGQRWNAEEQRWEAVEDRFARSPTQSDRRAGEVDEAATSIPSYSQIDQRIPRNQGKPETTVQNRGESRKSSAIDDNAADGYAIGVNAREIMDLCAAANMAIGQALQLIDARVSPSKVWAVLLKHQAVMGPTTVAMPPRSARAKTNDWEDIFSSIDSKGRLPRPR